MKLTIGSKVKLSQQGAARWGNRENDDPTNPIGAVGEVYLNPRYGKNFPYDVRWSTGYENCYREGDLELIKPRMEENE